MRPICRPIRNQQEYYSGHKKVHSLRYQSLVTPDGLIIHLTGPFGGRRHDAGVFAESNSYNQLLTKVRFSADNKFVLYADSAYPIRELLLKPYARNTITPLRQQFNTSMSSVREAVEWAFGKICVNFAFGDLKKNQKILLQGWQACIKCRFS